MRESFHPPCRPTGSMDTRTYPPPPIYHLLSGLGCPCCDFDPLDREAALMELEPELPAQCNRRTNREGQINGQR